MSWGERSCLKPCRTPDTCSIETCNIDCFEYIRDIAFEEKEHKSNKTLSYTEQKKEDYFYQKTLNGNKRKTNRRKKK